MEVIVLTDKANGIQDFFSGTASKLLAVKVNETVSVAMEFLTLHGRNGVAGKEICMGDSAKRIERNK